MLVLDFPFIPEKLFVIFGGSHSGYFLKLFAKMAMGGKGQITDDLCTGIIEVLRILEAATDVAKGVRKP